MALIRRGNKHYLIRSVRRGGKVTSHYLAHGARAIELDRALRQLAPRRPDRYELWEAKLERRELDRAERRAEREATERRRQERELEARVKGLATEAKFLANGAMLAAGYRQHRWAWRKKRGVDMGLAQSLSRAIVAAITDKLGPMVDLTPEEQERVRAEAAHLRSPAGVASTVDKWESYDKTRASELPSAVEAMAKMLQSDPTRGIVEDLVCKYSDDDITRELLRRQHRRELAELCGPEPSVIERRLAERAMTCWLDLQIKERLAIRLHDSLNFTPAEKNYFDKAADRAHRRYTDTLRCLALVRRRALPAMRLSVGVRSGDGGAEAVVLVETPDGRRADPAIENPATTPTENHR